jgi:hypothetical protein
MSCSVWGVPYDAELIGDGDGLASGDTRTPSCYDVVEPLVFSRERIERDRAEPISRGIESWVARRSSSASAWSQSCVVRRVA